eukprot:scaffold12211_cov116-Isochrysis_galbana.AAC.5
MTSSEKLSQAGGGAESYGVDPAAPGPPSKNRLAAAETSPPVWLSSDWSVSSDGPSPKMARRSSIIAICPCARVANVWTLSVLPLRPPKLAAPLLFLGRP